MTSLLQQRWRSRQLVGDASHALIVRLRKGHMHAGYFGARRIDDIGPDGLGSPIYPPLIWKGTNIDCFKKEWTPTTAWRELPNVVSVKWSQSFDPQTGGQKGAATATIIMDNIGFTDVTGVGGLYHKIDRGYYSPGRGVTTPPRAKLWKDAANTWKEVLRSGWQVEIWEGYGSGADVQLRDTLDPLTNSYAPAGGALSRTYTGLVTDFEQDSHPDQITLTAQDFSIFLTDQRLAGWNKALEVPSPVTFADRKRTMGEKKLNGPYHASSNSVTGDGDWTSNSHTDRTDTTAWVEIVLPQGYYEDFFVDVKGTMKAFLSLKLNGTGTMDRVHPLPSGWVNLSGTGTGTVDGIPYMRSMTIQADPARRWGLGHGFNVPDGSRLRLTFTNLYKDNGLYYAGTNQFAAYRFNSFPDGAGAKAKGWILVEDAAEVIRMLLIWAGFQEWHVEDWGWSLFNQVVYGADKHAMDIITDALQQANFIFFMGPPSNDDRSIGKPHFEYNNALDPPSAGTLQVRDTDMTEALSTKWDLSTLPDIIRYQGAINKKHGATLLGYGIEGLTKRYRAAYYPPWAADRPVAASVSGVIHPAGTNGSGIIYSAGGVARDSSINRQFTETMGTTFITQLNSNPECLFACVLAAINYALNMATVQFQIPGIAPLRLNDQIGVADEAAAVNSRVWVNSIDSEHVTGGGQSPGHWRMTVSGSLIDTPDMATIKHDYNYARKRAQPYKAALASKS